MGLSAILALGACAWLLGWAAPRRRFAGLLQAISIVAAFGLQTLTALRSAESWLPALSIALTALTWAVTRPARPRSGDLAGLGIAAGTVLLIALTRYLGPLCCLGPARPPPVDLVLAGAVAAATLIAIPLLFPAHNRVFSWIALLLLIGVFIVLKTPALTLATSAALRRLGGQAAEAAAASDLAWLGFSFLAFRLIAALRDFQAGKLPALSFTHFAAYALFFPAFVAGPIDRLPRWNGDLERVAADAEGAQAARLADLTAGAQHIFTGVFKKFALADSLALFALNPQNAAQTDHTGWMWLLLLSYTLRIYFDFSGYTDVALGLARWMGFRLPENFDRPYLKTNLTAFWNAWHITLAAWFRAYVFNPLTRFLRMRALPQWAIILSGQLAVMGLIGLWHGVTMNFLIWGLWHGVGLFIHNRWASWVRPRLEFLEARPGLRRAAAFVGWAATFLFVTLGWVWFALPDFDLARRVFGVLFGGWG